MGLSCDGDDDGNSHDGLNLLRGQSLSAEFGVQLDENFFSRHGVGRFLRRVPPTRPSGDVTQDAVRWPAQFRQPSSAFREAGTKDGEKSFNPVHRALECFQPLPGEFEEADSSAGSLTSPLPRFPTPLIRPINFDSHIPARRQQEHGILSAGNLSPPRGLPSGLKFAISHLAA